VGGLTGNETDCAGPGVSGFSYPIPYEDFGSANASDPSSIWVDASGAFGGFAFSVFFAENAGGPGIQPSPASDEILVFVERDGIVYSTDIELGVFPSLLTSNYVNGGISYLSSLFISDPLTGGDGSMEITIANPVYGDDYFIVIEDIYGCPDTLQIDLEMLGNNESCISDNPWDIPNIITDCFTQLLIPEGSVIINEEAISTGDWLGVFYTDDNGDLQCGGYEIWTGESTSLAIWGDDNLTEEKDGFDDGEILTWIVWDNETNQLFENVTVEYTLGSEYFTCNDFYIASTFTALSSMIQEIPILSGWYIFSTYLELDNSNIQDLVSPLLENTIIVKNWQGDVYWPLVNINTIGDIVPGQGYQIKSTAAGMLEFEGQLISSETPIEMPGGWFIISYLHQNPADAEDMMAPVLDDLVIVKNWQGDVYWPLVNINTIGNMTPGQGYQIKTTNPIDFVYPDIATARYSFENNEHISSIYKKPINTGNNMIVGIPDNAWYTEPMIGDELVAYDIEGNIVGNAPYREGASVITIWGDDQLTERKDGLFEGEKFYLELWRSENRVVQKLDITNWEQGGDSYVVNGISLAASIIQSTESDKKLVKICDVLGREIDPSEYNKQNNLLLYIYDDGTIERKFIKKP